MAKAVGLMDELRPLCIVCKVRCPQGEYVCAPPCDARHRLGENGDGQIMFEYRLTVPRPVRFIFLECTVDVDSIDGQALAKIEEDGVRTIRIECPDVRDVPGILQDLVDQRG